MSEERPPYGNPIELLPKPLAWLPAPTCAGWWIASFKPGQFSDLILVHYDGRQCLSEIGAPMGTPTTAEFERAKWCGPVERP